MMAPSTAGILIFPRPEEGFEARNSAHDKARDGLFSQKYAPES